MYISSSWDSRHLVSFTGGYKLPNNWELSARYRFAGQTPFVPTDLEATLDVYPEIVPDYSRLGEEKLGAFSQLDVRIDKRWNFPRLSLDVFLEFQNALAQAAPQAPEYVLRRTETGAFATPRQLDLLTDDEGAFIPVIGIIVDF